MSSRFNERVHGGGDAAELERRGAAVSELVDFSVNLNPYGPCKPVVEAAAAARLDRYPDLRATAARAAWARELAISPSEIAVGHGAADLFWAITRAFVRAGDRVIVAGPTFSEMYFAAQAAGAEVVNVTREHGEAGLASIDELSARGKGARLLYLCSPNNPTGCIVRPTEVRALASQLPDTRIVLDQAFLSLSDHAADLAVRFPPNVICVRSLTKDFALAGLRIAYLVAAPELVDEIERARPTWATSAPALAAITEAAAQGEFVRNSYARLREDRAHLVRGLEALGLSPRPSCTVFVLLPVADAAQTCALLLTRGLSARDGTSFGLPQQVRIAVRPSADTARLLDALRSLRSASGVQPNVLA
jgi:histidinol-phosphate/aromatic aminotransferase/cobyric acid decarboxylase-like protein